MRVLLGSVLLCWLSLGVSNTPTKKGRETIYRPASHAATLSRPAKVRAPVTPKKVVSEHVTITEIKPKKVDPTCVHPKTLGFPSVTTCGDLLTVGSLDRGLIWLQSGLSNCTFMNDLSCDDGSGAGLEQYRHHLQGKGYNAAGDVGADRLGALGDCLKVSKRANGDYDIANAIRGEVLCCRVTCDSPPITTVETALLPLDDDPIPMPTPVTTITTAAPMATPLGVPSPMCILPGFLDLPRVRTCEDLKDVAASTEYLSLTSSSLLECDWVQDLTCTQSYPGYGIAVGSARPHGSCLALRQNICDTNVIGAWPLLSRHFRGLCKLPAPTTQTITAVTMPTKKGHTSRALRPKDMASAPARSMLQSAPARRLAGNTASMLSASDSLLVCCRLDCNGGLSLNNNNLTQLQPTPEIAYSEPIAPAPTVVLGNGSGYASGGSSSGETPKVAMAARDEIDLDDSLCHVRYAPICQLASPLRGERIVFDQNCLGANMPAGCFAGGLSRCCRSIPQ